MIWVTDLMFQGTSFDVPKTFGITYRGLGIRAQVKICRPVLSFTIILSVHALSVLLASLRGSRADSTVFGAALPPVRQFEYPRIMRQLLYLSCALFLVIKHAIGVYFRTRSARSLAPRLQFFDASEHGRRCDLRRSYYTV